MQTLNSHLTQQLGALTLATCQLKAQIDEQRTVLDVLKRDGETVRADLATARQRIAELEAAKAPAVDGQ